MFTFYCNLDSTYKRIAYYLPNSQYIVTVRTRFLANTSKHPQTIVYILNHLHKLLATASEKSYTKDKRQSTTKWWASQTETSEASCRGSKTSGGRKIVLRANMNLPRKTFTDVIWFGSLNVTLSCSSAN